MHRDVKNTIESGAIAEAVTAQHLQQAGIRIIERNYRCKLGEIDIIGFDREVLVFIEVRQRRRGDYGNGLDSVTRSKQQKVIRAARLYLLERKFFDNHPCRFDIVSVNSADELDWIKDAFQAF